VQRASFQFFWDNVNPYAGLVKDRCQSNGPDSRNLASIAATGFGLTALCIADKRGWQDGRKIRERVRNTLRFASNKLGHAHGYFCHFIDMHSGERAFHSEASSIDTAIFLCGALTCRGYFDDAEIQDLAGKLYERVDWPWLLQGEKTLAMAWTPEQGFTKARWDSYSEMIMVLLLGLGSPTHALRRKPGTLGNGRASISRACRSSEHMLRFSYTNIRKRGSTCADSATSTSTTTSTP